MWLLSKLEKRIKHWSFKWLSRTDRLVLIKSVLETILIFYTALAWVPKGILATIRKLCGRFLRPWSKEEVVLPWVAWENITLLKSWGGWGIKDLTIFAKALSTKVSWRLLTTKSLWTSMVFKKYIFPLS